MGTGVAWIATEVFEKMKKPWFDFVWMEEKQCFQGEDHYFFMKAQEELGYEIYVDQDISKCVRHLGVFGYNPVAKSMLPKIKEDLSQ